MARIPNDREIFHELTEAHNDLENIPRRQTRRLERFLTAYIHERRMALSQVREGRQEGGDLAEYIRGMLVFAHQLRDMCIAIGEGEFQPEAPLDPSAAREGEQHEYGEDDLADG